MARQKSFTVGPDGKEWDRKVINTTVSLYERDNELLEWIQRNLGCSRAEALRTCIRSFAGQLSQIPTKITAERVARIGATTPSLDSINADGDT